MTLNNRDGILTMVKVFVLIFFSVAAAAAAGAEPLVLDSAVECYTLDQKGAKQRPPVRFPHEDHMMTADCLDCHHDYEDGENVLDPFDLEDGNTDPSCCGCHHPGAQLTLEDAFHKQCISCHLDNRHKFWIPRKGIQWKALTREGAPAGPVLCGECHENTGSEESPAE